MEDKNYVIKFAKPFEFEGETYKEIDLSGMENLKASDLKLVGRIVGKNNPAANPVTLEMTLEYAIQIAARVTGEPLEFFEALPANEAMKLKSEVVGFLYGGDGSN